MLLQREPPPTLRPFVSTMWASSPSARPSQLVAPRERVLPTGHAHVVFRLTDHPLRLFADDNDVAGRSVGNAVLGGARAAPYLRDVSQPSASVGAQLRPGATELLFGEPANALAGRHVPLDELWGRFAALVHEQLSEIRRPERQLDVLECVLKARLPRLRGLNPAVAQALVQFPIAPDVRAAVRQSGYSHRRFIALFRRAVGLTPKLYCRLLRFQRAIELIQSRPIRSWARLALDAGYSDQAHLIREFREFAGVTPGEYAAIAPRLAFHLPVVPAMC